jgi:hypothetical protein
MYVTDPPRPFITSCHVEYVKKIFSWKKQVTTPVGQIFKIHGFDQHNWLVDVNQIFSTNPAGMLVDRTQTVNLPLCFDINRPWNPPTLQYTLEQALQTRVNQLVSTEQKLNLFWSGGIDSTTMLTAFLKYVSDRSQLRIFYTPFSTYEHPTYLDFLKKFDNLELVDLSGMTYSTCVFDGLFLTGDGGDELMASVDESFFQSYGRSALDQSWQDFFYKKNSNDTFIDFCQEYFLQAQRPIDTVLEARWFFYAMCKTRFQLLGKIDLFVHYPEFVPARLQGFFDCPEFESYVYWNLDQIIPGSKYSDWKLPFKQYCVEFDCFDDYFKNKKKHGSGQTHWYANKNRVILDRRSIFILNNGQRITTPNLPLFSQREFKDKYNNTLDYLFNEPDQV